MTTRAHQSKAPQQGWCARVVVGAFVVGSFVGSCRCGSPAVAVDAGAVQDDDLTTTLTPEQEAKAIELVHARLPEKHGACAQVRSVHDRAEAEAAAALIRKETALPVELIDKDLGARGVWSRICVGDEESGARLTAMATRWVSPGGVLEKFLDPPTGHDPRFFVLEKSSVDPRQPTLAQAKAFLARSASGPAFFVGPPAAPLLAGTGAAHGAISRVVVVDAEGKLLPLDPSPPPGCASCAVAEQKSPITGRRVVAAGDLFGDANAAVSDVDGGVAAVRSPGDEVLVEEETQDGTRFLAILVDDNGTLRRRGAVLLSAASVGVILRGEASVVEADGDDDRELAINRLELRTSMGTTTNNEPAKLCSLDTHADLWGTPTSTTDPTKKSARGLVKIDVVQLAAAPNGDAAVVDFITALDGAGDAGSASRACARVLADRPSSLASQLCLQRVRTLVADKKLVDAVNAAGALAEGTPALRAAVAAPFFAAMSALDGDPRLTAAPFDCQTEPLVNDMSSKSLDDVIAAGRARQQERLSLASVDDAVFVTATRDFGPDTPVGQIAARWLERLRSSQPARQAAIEALLLPPSEPTNPSTNAATNPTVDAGPGSGFGGAP